MKKLYGFVAALFLSGCVSVQTQVEAYSEVPSDIEPKTVYIAAFSGDDATSMAWRQSAGALATVLSEKGFKAVSSKKDARLVAFFGYAVDKGQIVTSQYSIPQWGITGYSGANTYGSFYGNSYSSTTTLNPTYGVTGYSTGTRTEKLYTRSVKVVMMDQKTKKRVFEGLGVSTGSCAAFGSVAPQIIGAVLSEFPKGRVGTVTLPLDGSC